MAETSRSNTKKRARDDEEGGDAGKGSAVETLEHNLTFSDTLVALRMMRAQFPTVEKVSIQPFVLQSQLYSSLKDRTQVDRDLEILKKEKVLRVFKLNTGQDDHAVMFMDDYLKQESVLEKAITEDGLKIGPFSNPFYQIEMAFSVKRFGQNDNNEVFEWFKQYVIETELGVSIDHDELCSLLSHGGRVKDEHVTLLINAGLLIRQLIDPNMYWFSIPNIGSILKGLSQGRKELLSFINRRKYKEMILALLEKKRLRSSQLDMRFHVRDLIGSGHLKTLPTPTGLVVRISKD